MDIRVGAGILRRKEIRQRGHSGKFDVLLTLFIPLAIFAPQSSFGGHLYSELFLLPFVGLCLLKRHFLVDPVVVFCFLLLAISNYVSILVNDFGHLQLEYFNQGYTYAAPLMFFLAGLNLGARRSRKVAVVVTFGCLVLMLVIGWAQLVGFGSVRTIIENTWSTESQFISPSRYEEGRFRLTSTADGNPHFLGVFMLFGTLMAVFLADNSRGRRQVIAWIAVVAFVMGVYATGSKTYAIGLLVFFGWFFFFRKGRLNFRRRFLWLVIAAGSVVFVVKGPFAEELSYLTRGYSATIERIRNGEGLSGTRSSVEDPSRLHMWSALRAQIGSRFLFGVGAADAEAMGQQGVVADSDYVFHLYRGGVLMLAAFLILKLHVLRRLGMRTRPTEAGVWGSVLRSALAAFVAVTLLTGFTVPASRYDRFEFIFWTFAGIAFRRRNATILQSVQTSPSDKGEESPTLSVGASVATSAVDRRSAYRAP